MATEIKVPNIGVDEVEVTEILVKVGEKVKTEQSLITVEGDKTSIEVPAPFSGTIKEININIGDKISAGSLIMILEEDSLISDVDLVPSTSSKYTMSDQNTCIDTSFTKKTEEVNFNKNSYVHATPLIRRLARAFGTNLEKVKGTGRKGRVLREDLQSYIRDVMKRVEATNSIMTTTGNSEDVTSWKKVDFRKFGEIKEIELSRIQKISGNNLSRNWMAIPHVTHFDKTDITNLEEFRKQQNIEAEERKLDMKLTPVVFIIKAVSAALEKMPRFNSSLSEDGQRLILKKYVNISVAVDTPNGLVVPVIKDVNKKNITELSYELKTISKKARDNKLTANEIQGGCFTISSIGKLGTTYFTPIINAPEVAILGISKSVIEPVWDGKEFTPRLMMPISLSFDHRVIDGADGARFITIVNNMLSDIRRLIM